MRLTKSSCFKLFFLAAVSTQAVAANTPSVVQALQCAPVKADAQTAIKKAPLLKTWKYDYEYDYGYFYTYNYTSYNTLGQKPFGLKAKETVTETETISSYLKLTTTLDTNYDLAKKAVLKAFGQTACSPETGTAGTRNCSVTVPASQTAKLSGISVFESAGAVKFYCRYK